MRFTAYIILMLAISIVLYFMGYRPIVNLFDAKDGSLTQIYRCDTGVDPICTDQNSVVGAILAIILVASVLVTLVAGFSALYIIPILIMMVVLNFFIFPLNFLMAAPDWLRIPLIVFFDTLTVLATINFSRGGG